MPFSALAEKTLCSCRLSPSSPLANDHGNVFESALSKDNLRSLKHHLSRLSELAQLVEFSPTLRKSVDCFCFCFLVRSSRSSSNRTTWPSWLHTVHLKPRWPPVRVSARSRLTSKRYPSSKRQTHTHHRVFTSTLNKMRHEVFINTTFSFS